VEYTQAVIRNHGLLPDSPEIENWPWPVRIYTLGRFEVRTNGDMLGFEGKAQHKPMELAKALVALGGRDVPADKLIDILWPEPSESDGHKAFDITVHRLRKLLGSDKAVHVADRRATLDPQVVWVDAWALERTLAPLIAAVNATEPEIALLEAAAARVLDLYRGHFLAGETEEAWQIPIRNRLAGRFQRFALRLGEHWESQQQWRRAFELYQRAIELDFSAESFYRRQMICLQAQGQRAEAIEVFRRCRQALSITLGVAPTGETEAVYRQLLAS
jgi:DNA-binding SARP family transcriptional activator